MKEKTFGLKKEPINITLQKIESVFIYEKIEIELELKNWIKENNKLRVQLKEETKKFINKQEDQTLWDLGKERMSKIAYHLEKQKEMEIQEIGKSLSEENKLIQLQIEEIELEIQSTERLYTKMFKEIAKIVEQLEKEGSHLEAGYSSKKYNVQVNSMHKSVETNLKDDTLLIEEEIQLQNHEKSIGESKQKAENILGSIQKNDTSETKSEEVDEAILPTEDSLIHQINSIKSQYIVGKMTGKDLYDAQGNLIISKSKVISSRVVNRAHREGKLAELIVNMKISGLGED